MLGRGICVAQHTVELLIQRAGISARPQQRRVAPAATAEDLVERKFTSSQRDRLWVTDITETPHPRGQGVLRRRLGRLLPARRRLVHRHLAIRRAGDQGAGDRGRSPQPAGPGAVDGLRRGLPRQRDDRVDLVAHAGRAAQPAAMGRHASNWPTRLGVPRDLPQPPAPPHLVGHADHGRVTRTDPEKSWHENPVRRLHRTRGRLEPPPSDPRRFRPLAPNSPSRLPIGRRPPRSLRWRTRPFALHNAAERVAYVAHVACHHEEHDQCRDRQREGQEPHQLEHALTLPHAAARRTVPLHTLVADGRKPPRNLVLPWSR